MDFEVSAADCLVALLATVFCGIPEGQVRTELFQFARKLVVWKWLCR